LPNIIDFVKEGNGPGDARGVAANALTKISEEGNRPTRPSLPFLKSIAAEFRESIQAAIPHIQAFLRDTDYNIRGAGASALAKFSDQGDIPVRSVVAPLRDVAAEFRGLIGACISQIADLLGDNNWYVRRTSANALAKLSAQGVISVQCNSHDLNGLQPNSESQFENIFPILCAPSTITTLMFGPRV
jgi:HEAT repeat protein